MRTRTLLPPDYKYFLNYVRPKVVIVDATTLERVRKGAQNSIFSQTILLARQEVPPLQKKEVALQPFLDKASPILEAAPTSKNDLFYKA